MNNERGRFSSSASPATSIGLEISGSRRNNIFSRIRQSKLEWITAASVIWAVACGGRADVKADNVSKETQPTVAAANLTAEPTKVIPSTSAATPPEVPRPIKTVEAVKLLLPSEVTVLVDLALASVPASDNKTNAKNAVRRAEVAMSNIGNPSNVVGALNDYGNSAKWIVQLACSYPDNSNLADSFFAIRDVSLNLITEQTGKGGLAIDSASFIKFNLQIPSDCKNPYLLEGKTK